MKAIGNEIIFTKKERERIDQLLKEGEEIQRQNGNRLYTDEEVWKPILGEKYYNELIQNEMWGHLGRDIL